MSRCTVAAVLLVLISPLAARADFGWFGHARPVRSYYYPVPVVYAPVAPVVYVPVAPVVCQPPPVVAVPQPSYPPPPANGYATPAPAPASGSPPPSRMPSEPPSTSGPGVKESRFYEPYSVASFNPAKERGERCSVVFWNVTGRDLTLRVNRESRTLPRGKSLTIELPRQFTWQVEGHDAQVETIAPGDAAVEFVIRR
jgi:hypothetical protein